jgi:hypothetical protein
MRKKNMMGTYKKMKMTWAMKAQGISQMVLVYKGEPNKFSDWVKTIEKYQLLMGGDPNNKILVAFQTSAGVVSHFVQRFIDGAPNDGRTWAHLKTQLTQRFAEVTASKQNQANHS